MTDMIAGHPFWRVVFDKDGACTTDGGLPAELAGSGVTDLFMFSHGWGNETHDAESLYQGMFPLVAQAAAQALPGRTVGFAGVFWPSIEFPQDKPPAGPAADAAHAAAATPSGAEMAATMAPAFSAAQRPVLDRLGELADQQPKDGAQLKEFQTLLGQLTTSTGEMAPEDAGERQILAGRPAAVFGTLSTLSKASSGDAEGLGDVFTTLWHGAIEAWRATSFYEMKGRAGTVGKVGLGPFVSGLAAAHPGLSVHLAGHSFGARVVSFALAGLTNVPAGGASPVKSLVLVQGAFSHYAFTNPLPWGGHGALAGMQAHVDGPLLATFSSNDRAVGWWYPAASLLSHTDSESAADLAKRWMAMGADGYQVTGVSRQSLAPSGHDYGFANGSFYSLDSSAVIANMANGFAGAHSDIKHPEVAWAMANAAR